MGATSATLQGLRGLKNWIIKPYSSSLGSAMLGLGLDGFAIVATIMTLPKPKMMMRLRKERKLSYIRVNTASEFLAGLLSNKHSI